MEDSKDLVPVEGKVVEDVALPSATPQLIPTDFLKKLARESKERVEAWNEIKKSAITTTNPSDWIDQGGKPYLQSSGAEKIANYFGIAWHIADSERISLEDAEGNYMYSVTLELSWGGRAIDMTGTRNSRDDFFRVRYDKAGNKIRLPLSEVDPGDVMKAAITNALQRGITRLLGFGNMTWEDLAKYGIGREKVGAVRYKGSKEKPKPRAKKPPKENRPKEDEPSETQAPPEPDIRKPVSEDEMRQAIYEMAYEETDGDEAEIKRLLGDITSFEGKDGPVPGVSSVEQLKGRRLQVSYHKMKEHHKEWKKLKDTVEGFEAQAGLPME